MDSYKGTGFRNGFFGVSLVRAYFDDISKSLWFSLVSYFGLVLERP